MHGLIKIKNRYISLFTTAILENYTSDFLELFEATTYVPPGGLSD